MVTDGGMSPVDYNLKQTDKRADVLPCTYRKVVPPTVYGYGAHNWFAYATEDIQIETLCTTLET